MVSTRNPEADLFIVLAYDTLRGAKSNGDRYESLHTVWNGFNQAFRRVFPGVDPIAYTRYLADEGLVQLGIARGGAFLKPCRRFIEEAQRGQEELGLVFLRFLEDVAATARPCNKPWEPGDAMKRLKDLGYL